MLRRYFFKEVSNTALVIFRVFFGLLMTIESWGAIATGWVKRTFVDTDFTFTFMGFEWTQFMLGEWMYLYYFIMGIFGLGIMLGYKYFWSALGFLLMWALSYFMQKTHYNNHYYLIMLISGLMIFVPANRYFSIDAKQNPGLKKQTAPYWAILAFKIQVSLVYFYAAIAKLYPGWYENRFLSIRLQHSSFWFKQHFGDNLISKVITYEPFQYFLTYAGIFFDFLIAPLLFFKQTRWIAFVALLIFHLTNSALLHIGIFPFFALALAVFFFSTDSINSIFRLKNNNELKKENQELQVTIPKSKRQTYIMSVVILFLGIQALLPLRHWLIPGDVLWTEEGHRLSWRMMLRTKATAGIIKFKVKIPEINKSEDVKLNDYITMEQVRTMGTKPDMIWQFAQYLEKKYKEKGYKDIEVYADSEVSVNGSPYYQLTEKTVDLTSVPWKIFGHQDWIMPTPDLYAEEKKSHKIER